MNKLQTIKIKKCRLCKSNSFIRLHSYGNLFVSNFVDKKNIKKGIRAPLNLLYCKHCKLLQLEHSAPQEIMYKRFYWYRSGVTETMKVALKDIYNSVLKLKLLKKGDTVLDIGANDGTLLSYFKKQFITVGCEPAKNLTKELKKNCKFVLNDFWSFKKYLNISKLNNLKPPKVITAIGMFYDLEDPSEFIKDAFHALDQDGVFIAQLMCLDSMIKKNDLGNVCHEHLEFYSYESLKYLFEKNGFKIYKVEKNEINGGSYRVFCKKNIKKSIKVNEKTSLTEIKKFIKRVEINKEKCLNFLKKAKLEKKKIFLYGASTKGNTLLQYYGLDSKTISYAAERSPEKWGKYTVGSGIKIISETKARSLKPDYFFVMPYGFINEFIKREKQWIKKGGTFLLPYPFFKKVN